MCGFVALLCRDGGAPDRCALDAATDLLAHRGPDDRSVFVDGPLGVGFRRLSIFDLTGAARQPMASADGRHVLAFNGAIYNWPELRAELDARGHVFGTQCDTEVLLAAWREWGPDCLHRLNGMFAFVVWDRIERRLCGARDRFGVKPLYWCRDARGLGLASEIKALRATHPGGDVDGIDWDTVADHVANDRLDARDETFFAGIRRLPAGTWFEADADGRFDVRRWWSLDEAVAARTAAGDPAAEFADLFEDAVRLRLRGDVRVGVLLSGGLDSTSIACAMARERERSGGEVPHAFGFTSPDPAHDESDALAATIARTGARFERVLPSPVDLWGSLERHLHQHDEPVYSASSLVAETLVASARRAGVKVLLNGQGADEVLGGYPMYFSVHWSELLRTGRWLRATTEMRRFTAADPKRAAPHVRAAVRDALIRAARALPAIDAIAARRRRIPPPDDWVSPELRRRAEPHRPAGHASLHGALRTSLERSDLPVYLRQEDRNAMAHGVEARLPFLDHRLVTLAFSLGSAWKLDSPFGKRLLREAMRDRIPEIVRTQVRKLGFPTPVDAWFRGPLYEPMRDLLASRAMHESGVWRPDVVIGALDRHRAGEISVGSRLFDVAQSLVWLTQVAAPTSRHAAPAARVPAASP